MNPTQVFMEPDKVRKMAQAFKQFAQILNKVNQVLDVQMMLLKSSYFIGMVGGAAVERYLSVIQPQIQQLAKKCEEISADVEKSVAAWEAAQQAG